MEKNSGMIPTTPFPYVLLHDRMGRKGERCRIVKPGMIVLVEFEDGFRTLLSRMAIRRDYGKGTETTATGDDSPASLGPR